MTILVSTTNHQYLGKLLTYGLVFSYRAAAGILVLAKPIPYHSSCDNKPSHCISVGWAAAMNSYNDPNDSSGEHSCNSFYIDLLELLKQNIVLNIQEPPYTI